ncbi:hypothetical protein H2203_003336 [Taxawa tesnikishii (nom. ined.)]|nr:hypothetical protein H2203_003336 [Dothideales sp. JES 119]
MAIDIADVGVLELLTEDSRPTFILETHTHGLAAYKHPQIVFRNKALVGFLGAGGSGSFETWVATLGIHGIEGIQASTFRGRAWTFTTLRHRWLVVYCSQQQEESAELVDLPSPPASEGPDPSRANSICDHPPSVRQCLSSGATRPFDWIRSPDSELSPHQCLLKNHDWAATSLGPISRWSTSLKQAVFITGANPNPKVILWGEELIMIYNEAAAHVFGAKHPAALGARAGEIWSEVWDDLSEVVRLAVEEGKTTRLPASLLFLERYGYVEESYWSIMVLPFVDPQGYVVGAIDEFFELTASVLFKRRRDTLEKLPDLLSNTLSLEQLWTQFLSGLEECREDVPFAVLYALDDDTPSSSGPASPLNDPAKLYTLRGPWGSCSKIRLYPTPLI